MSNLFARRRTLALLAMLATAAGAVTLSACGDDDNGPSGNGSLAIALAPASLDIPAGTSGTTDFTVTRTSPFTSAVTLAASGAPASFDITLTPAILAAGETTGTVTVTVAGGATPGSYPVTISAGGTGVTTVSTTLTVTVIEVAGLKR